MEKPDLPKAEGQTEKERVAALEKLTRQRLQDARRQKAPFEWDMLEGYTFAAPHRALVVNSTAPKPVGKIQDIQSVNTSFAFEMCGDFPTVIINTFCPQTQCWVTRRPSTKVPDDQIEQVAIAAAQADDAIFKSIVASNFYAEIGKAFNPDLALGTIGLWIDHPKPWRAPVVQAVPIRELEINIGPDGQIDDRFVVRHVKYRYLNAILKDYDIPKQVKEKGDQDGNLNCIVVWGFWKIYDESSQEQWKHVITVNGHMCHEATLKGNGVCPLIVARFNATPDWAWGIGPLIQSLPDLRIIDELQFKKVKTVDLALNPPISFPDSSFTNIQEGIEAGMAYAIRPGEEGAIKNLYMPPSLDAALFLTNDLETRIKRLFFLDWPQQDGKTPPTATQWLDEMTLAQRRIGTPGLVFWQEFCAGVFQRFSYLLEKSGDVPKITFQGEGGKKEAVTMMPYNPALRSAEQEEVALFSRFAQIGAAAFPEEWKISTDGTKTLQNIADKMGVDNMWKRRNPAEVAAAIGQISQVMGGTPAGGPAMDGGGAGGSPMDSMAGPDAAAPKPRLSGGVGGAFNPKDVKGMGPQGLTLQK
jgi:Bacteriophage head to tail connecting protein